MQTVPSWKAESKKAKSAERRAKSKILGDYPLTARNLWFTLLPPWQGRLYESWLLHHWLLGRCDVCNRDYTGDCNSLVLLEGALASLGLKVVGVVFWLVPPLKSSGEIPLPPPPRDLFSSSSNLLLFWNWFITSQQVPFPKPYTKARILVTIPPCSIK